MIIVIVIIITLITNRGTVRNPYWNSGLLQLRRLTSRLATWARICILFVFFCCLCLALFTLTCIFFHFFQCCSICRIFSHPTDSKKGFVLLISSCVCLKSYITFSCLNKRNCLRDSLVCFLF